MSETLNLPEHIIPIGMVVVGVKEEEKAAIDRYDETKSILTNGKIQIQYLKVIK